MGNASYSVDSFDDGTDPWRDASISLTRKTRVGSLIVRGTRAERVNEEDQLGEVDFYPRFRPGTYAYVSAGFTPSPVLSRNFALRSISISHSGTDSKCPAGHVTWTSKIRRRSTPPRSPSTSATECSPESCTTFPAAASHGYLHSVLQSLLVIMPSFLDMLSGSSDN